MKNIYEIAEEQQRDRERLGLPRMKTSQEIAWEQQREREARAAEFGGHSIGFDVTTSIETAQHAARVGSSALGLISALMRRH